MDGLGATIALMFIFLFLAGMVCVVRDAWRVTITAIKTGDYSRLWFHVTGAAGALFVLVVVPVLAALVVAAIINLIGG